MNFHVYLGADTFKPKSNQTNRIQLYCMLLWPGFAHPENRMIYMRSAPVPVQILKNVFFSANEWVRRVAAILINYSRVQLRTHASLPPPVSNKCARALERNFYQVLWVCCCCCCLCSSAHMYRWKLMAWLSNAVRSRRTPYPENKMRADYSSLNFSMFACLALLMLSVIGI